MAASTEDFQNRVKRFKSLVKMNRNVMINSIEAQFIHMAQGGDGSAAMEGEIRKTYYPTWSTKDFQTMCDRMGWDFKTTYEHE